MSVFNEKSHAFLAAKYFEYLLDEFDERGRRAFIHATQYYSGQRGRRMAQRAIRDGKELTYETYAQYGEWVNTEAIKEEGVANQRNIVSKSPDFVLDITTCPWATQFEQMGSPEAGREYCTHLDNSICRGFNPYITYDVELEKLQKDGEYYEGGYCTHLIRETDIEGMDMTKKTEYLKDFEYHCAHSYWSFREVVCAIFGFEGEKIAASVLEDFGEEYGEESVEKLYKYRYTNFNVTY